MKKPIAILDTDQHLDLDNISTWKSCMKEGDELALKYKIPRFLLGDLFESRKGQPQNLLNTVGDYFKESTTIKYIIPGNHDKVDYRSERSYLDEFEFHPNLNLIRNYKSIDIENVRIHFIPYFEEGELYLKYLKLAKADLLKGGKNVLLTHISITGSKNNDGEVIMGGLSQSEFDCFDLVLVGHYHDKGWITNKICYIGSLFQQNFAEDDDKGFTILYDDLSIERVKSTFKSYETINWDLNKINIKDINDQLAVYTTSHAHTRFVFFGSYEKVKSIDQSYYKSLGIDVKIKREQIDRGIQDVQLNEIIQFNQTTIVTEFEKFCEINGFDVEKGKKFLNKTLNK